MAATRKLQDFLGWLVLAICVSGLRGDCGPYEEDQPLVFRCSTSDPTYQIETNRLFTDGSKDTPVTCTDGKCTVNDATVTAVEVSNGTIEYTFNDADRTLQRISCYDRLNSKQLDQCYPKFYDDPVLLERCGVVKYSEDNKRADLTCIFDVYPDGTCSYDSWTGDDISGLGKLFMNETVVPKSDGLGNQIYTCNLQVSLEGSEEGEYGLKIIMDVNNYTDPYESSFDQIKLIALSLLSSDNVEYDYPDNGTLELTFTIEGWPRPALPTLAMKNDANGLFDIMVSKDYYQAAYSDVDSETYLLSVNISGGFYPDKRSDFEIMTSNGLKDSDLRVYFAVIGDSPPPTSATTAPPPPPSTEPPATDGDGDHDDDGHADRCGCHHHDDHHHDGTNHVHPPYSYYPGVGYAPYHGGAGYPYPGYGPWAGYVNPRFGGVAYPPYPALMDMGWYPYRGWFPWGG